MKHERQGNTDALLALTSIHGDSPGLLREMRRRLYADVPDGRRLDPTRYGDWEFGGRCTDLS